MIFWLLFLLNFMFSQFDFESPIKQAKINDNNLDEISGIDFSVKHNIMWCHLDSGGDNKIFGLNEKGETVCVLNLVGVSNRDWEDISYGRINEKYYIFVGELGDNDSQYPSKFIYYFEEPDELKEEIDIEEINKIEFEFPEKNHDCEAIMFDPVSRDLILISKRETNEKVYRIIYPYNNEELIVAEYMTELKIGNSESMLSWVTGSDISDDGRFILIKNYTNVYFWERGENLYQSISKNGFDVLNYIQAQEPQGEAICWNSETSGFYTVSEEIFGIEAYLHYFKMIDYSSIEEKKRGDSIDVNDLDLIFYDLMGNEIQRKDLENYFNKMMFCKEKSSGKIIKLKRHSN